MTAILEETPVEEMNLSCITFMNRTGDVTITFDEQNAEKIKEIIRRKMKEGYVFFTHRKVVFESIQIKRKIGPKGIDSIKSVIIDDETFDKLVADLDDKDIAEVLQGGQAQLAKLAGKRNFDDAKRVKTPEDVIKGKSALAFRPVVGG